MQLSIVTTLYYSAPYLEEFYTRICFEVEKITDDYEIIFVNDGSPDDALDIALSFHRRDDRIRVIDLSKNFGHHKAIMTGLTYSRGDLIFLIDCDLEEDPELLGKFYDERIRNDVDVVYGVQASRKGGVFERISGQVFYKFLNFLYSYELPKDTLTARLMTKRYVASLIEHREREIYIDGLWAITGFEQIPITVKKHSKGASTYDLRRKLSMAVNAITSFSNKPLVYIFYLGSVVLSLSTLAACYLIIRKIFFNEYLMGWPSLIVSIWFMGGLTFFCLGIIGIYLSKIFIETKQRPYTIIKKFYERREKSQYILGERSQESTTV